MPLQFDRREYAHRIEQAQTAMAEMGLDGLLMFRQESMYYLTGYDSFGFAFFQCLYLDIDGNIALLTRAPDLRQAERTSIIDDIRVWTDEGGARPAQDLRRMLESLAAAGKTLGVEYDCPGLNAAQGRALEQALDGLAILHDASLLVTKLRAIKSDSELEYVRRAGKLADRAYHEAERLVGPGMDEGVILAAQHSAIFANGGDYPGNGFIIGSGRDALLCRYKTGRAILRDEDQITLEWAGVYRHYHAAMMRTMIVGRPSPRHMEMHQVACDALMAAEAALKVGAEAGRVFDAYAHIVDMAGLREHRLNACGYGLAATFAPSWMDWPMFYRGNEEEIAAGMVFFVHIILMDSLSGTAMTLGRSSIVTDSGLEPLSSVRLDLVCK